MDHRRETAHDDGRHPRQGDRRQGIHAVVRALATHLVSGEPHVRLEGVFEAGLARALGADWLRTVRQGAAAGRLPAARTARIRANGPAAGQDVCFELALPGRHLDAWDEQLLETAAHLLTLALAADRQPVPRTVAAKSGAARRSPPVRAAATPPSRGRSAAHARGR